MIKQHRFLVLLPIAMAIGLYSAGGCGGDGGAGPKTATIAGIVTDIDGNPVRGALVHSRDASTTTSVSGSYTLPKNREEDLIIVAELSQDGVNYSGQNLARTFVGELTQSVNIVVSRDGDQAVLVGKVTDTNGNILEGVNVFAFGGGLSSSKGITDANGNYRIPGLVPGFSYTLNASGRNYSSDETAVVLDPRETRTVDFVLGGSSGEALGAPQNLSAVSWTAPAANRSADAAAYDAVKKLFDPRHKPSRLTRSTSLGRQIEAELFFDPILSLELLGYGIYRARGNDDFSNVTFWREPIAGYYADLDPALAPFTRYDYAVTALNTSYPNGSQSESGFSNVASVQTLGDLTLSGTTQNPLTFHWNSGSGAEEYVVFVFDRFPGVEVSSIWNNSDASVTGTSIQYAGPALQAGKTYYYLVLGLANNRDSRALSEIGSFIAH